MSIGQTHTIYEIRLNGERLDAFRTLDYAKKNLAIYADGHIGETLELVAVTSIVVDEMTATDGRIH